MQYRLSNKDYPTGSLVFISIILNGARSKYLTYN